MSIDLNDEVRCYKHKMPRSKIAFNNKREHYSSDFKNLEAAVSSTTQAFSVHCLSRTKTGAWSIYCVLPNAIFEYLWALRNVFHFIHGTISIRNIRFDIKCKHIVRNRFQGCMFYGRRSFCHLQIVNGSGIIVFNALFIRWIDERIFCSKYLHLILSINLSLIRNI